MIRSIKFTYFALVILFTLATTTLANAKNVALIIGNSLYTEAISQLENPANDARDVAAALQEQGYEVVFAVDLGQREMQATLIDFRAKADSAEIAIVYYAGHGIEIGGQNYIVPVDARLSDQRSAALELIDINTILVQISGASKLRMLVLDACRNNPFVSKMKRQGNGRNVGRGLSRIIDTQSETLIAFAAAAGEVTPDGEPGGNSPFTAAFLKALQGPAVDVRILLGKVRDEMRSTLLGSQPATYGSLGGNMIVINPLHEAKFEPGAEIGESKLAGNNALMTDFLQADVLSTLEAWDNFIGIYKAQEDRAIYQIALRKRESIAQRQAENAAAQRENIEEELALLRAQAAEGKRIAAEKVDAEIRLEKLHQKETAKTQKAVLQHRSEKQRASDETQPETALVAPNASDGSEPLLGVTADQSLTPQSVEVELDEAALAAIKDQAIRDLQVLLKDKSCYRGRVDGLIGPGTRGGIRTLSKLLNVDVALTAESPSEDFQKVFQEFDSAPDVVCPAVVVKIAPTPKKRATTSAPQTHRAEVKTAPKVVVPTPKLAETSKVARDFKDNRGNHCDWANRGNVCE